MKDLKLMKHEEFIKDIIESKSKFLNEVSTYIFEHPETRFQEYNSSKKLIETLKHEGFEVEENVANIDTAFLGKFGSGKPVIGFLGEFDALSGLSQEPGIAEHSPIEDGGNGHGCGHNLLGIGSLAAAIAVKEYLEANNLEGTVIYYGTPGEEGGSGKTFMSREGVFDDLDYAFCWHPAPINAVMMNKTLANYQVKFKFKGTSAHAAQSPELGRSALDAVELMNVGVNYMREHMSDTARVHYAVLNTGGTSPNVVQSDAEVLYLIRAETLKETRELFERVKKIAQGAALMTETESSFEIQKACSDYEPNRVLEAVMYDYLKKEEAEITFTDEELKFAQKIVDTLSDSEKEGAIKANESFGAVVDGEKVIGKPLSDVVHDYVVTGKVMLGSTDVADVSWVTPTAQISAATSAFGTPLHTWQMTAQGLSSYAFKGMYRAARVMANTAVHVLHDETLLSEMKEEHEEKLKKQPYENPIPKDVNPQP